MHKFCQSIPKGGEEKKRILEIFLRYTQTQKKRFHLFDALYLVFMEQFRTFKLKR